MGFIREDKTNGNNNDNNVIKTISSKILGTVPASTIRDNVPASDERLLPPISINNASINKDRRYYIEFLGSKKLCSLTISENNGNSIMCSIGNYTVQALEDDSNIVINIEKINEDDTTTINFTDLILYEEEVKYLNSKYLEDDLILQNSISLGRVGDIGTGSSAVGNSVTASGICSHAEGMNTKAIGMSSHAEGMNTEASGESSHAEGFGTKVTGSSSHAEGNSTTSSGMASHSEGGGTVASGMTSHAEGYITIASGDYQHVQGKYNIEDKANKYAHIVGNGEYGKNSNAHTLDWKGNAWYAGEIYVGGKSQDDGKKLLSTADIYFDENGKLCITINGVTKKFTPDSE